MRWAEPTSLFKWYLNAFIAASQKPPKLGALGGENLQLMTSETKKFKTSSLDTSLHKHFSSAEHPTKFAVLSLKITDIFPWWAKNLFRDAIIVSDVKSETKFKCTAWVAKYINIATQII